VRVGRALGIVLSTTDREITTTPVGGREDREGPGHSAVHNRLGDHHHTVSSGWGGAPLESRIEDVSTILDRCDEVGSASRRATEKPQELEPNRFRDDIPFLRTLLQRSNRP
jgi:hypothetical protein